MSCPRYMPKDYEPCSRPPDHDGPCAHEYSRDLSDFELRLDFYERDNLLWLLDVARRIGLDTGDWLEQIRRKLRLEDGPGNPNYPPGFTTEVIAQLRGGKR